MQSLLFFHPDLPDGKDNKKPSSPPKPIRLHDKETVFPLSNAPKHASGASWALSATRETALWTFPRKQPAVVQSFPLSEICFFFSSYRNRFLFSTGKCSMFSLAHFPVPGGEHLAEKLLGQRAHIGRQRLRELHRYAAARMRERQTMSVQGLSADRLPASSVQVVSCQRMPEAA